jgi:predicted nucleotidyltransferase
MAPAVASGWLAGRRVATLGSVIAAPSAILAAVDVVIERFAPDRVVLFGSYAYGAPVADSDVDLLILQDFVGSPHRQFALVRGALDVPFPLDVLVRRPAEVAGRITGGDCFLREVIAKGIVLYDATDARVGRQGRGRLRRRFDPAPVTEAEPV